MKKALVAAAVLILMTGMCAEGRCQDAFKKLGRGLVNVVTCPAELPKTVSKTYRDRGPVDAVGFGVPKGLAMMVLRAVMGTIEAVTFPFPIPSVGYDPIMKPEYSWQE